MLRRPAGEASAGQIFSFEKESILRELASPLALQAVLLTNRGIHLDAQSALGLPVRANLRGTDFGGEGFAIGPDRSIGKIFLLPDGNGPLQSVDQPAAGVECGGAMGRGNHDQHAGFANLQPP